MTVTLRELVRGRTLVSVAPEHSAQEAAEHMALEGVGFLVVVADQRAVGVVTDRDLALRVAGRPGALPADVAVHEVMSSPVVALAPDQDLDAAVRAMRTRGIRRVVVAEADGPPLAVLAMDDVLDELARELHGVARGAQDVVGEARRDARLAELREELEEAADNLTLRLQRASWLTREALSQELGALKHRLERALHLEPRD